jgi:hypothetical protein
MGCIDQLQVTASNYDIIADLHNLQSLHPKLFSRYALVFTGL